MTIRGTSGLGLAMASAALFGAPPPQNAPGVRMIRTSEPTPPKPKKAKARHKAKLQRAARKRSRKC